MLAATLALLICSIGAIILGDRGAHAAEVECVRKYEISKPWPEDIAKAFWPSGFRPTAGMCEEGFLHGTIVKGDYEKVATLYRDNHRLLTAFHLLSPGGDAEEAMKIGRLFRRYLITAHAPFEGSLQIHGPKNLCDANDQCECASGCALIWFGAVYRFGKVGLHRPRTADPRFKTMAPADASVAYKRILDEISRYLEEMEAPRTAIDAMVTTSSSEISWVESGWFDRTLERPPSIAEWSDASCGSFTENEIEKAFELVKKQPTGLTDNEKMLLQFLDKKGFNRDRCLVILFQSHIDRLPSPDVVAIDFEDLIPKHK